MSMTLDELMAYLREHDVGGWGDIIIEEHRGPHGPQHDVIAIIDRVSFIGGDLHLISDTEEYKLSPEYPGHKHWRCEPCGSLERVTDTCCVCGRGAPEEKADDPP